MAKKQHIVKLNGVMANGEIAKTHQADEVVAFTDENSIFRIPVSVGTHRYVTTVKGSTLLEKVATSHNMFVGVAANGIKIHFTHKKIVGKLIYWS